MVVYLFSNDTFSYFPQQQTFVNAKTTLEEVSALANEVEVRIHCHSTFFRRDKVQVGGACYIFEICSIAPAIANLQSFSVYGHLGVESNVATN